MPRGHQGASSRLITRKQLLALLAITLMWGINWPMMKFSLREMTPLYFRALTMSGGALGLFLFYRSRGLRMLPRGVEWRAVITLGLPNVLGWHTASILGVKELASGRAAILGFTMPIWTVLLGTLFLGEKLTVWMLILTSLCLWVLAFVMEPWPQWRFSVPMWGGLVYGAFINYGFAQIIWFGMARNLPPATSAMSIMAVPMIGTLAATLILGESPHWEDYVAMVCVMAAISAVLLPSRTVRAAAP